MMAMHDSSGANLSRNQGVSTSTCMFNLALVPVKIPHVEDIEMYLGCKGETDVQGCKKLIIKSNKLI